MPVQLFPHQEKALEETKEFNRVGYFLDMGLGKTFVGSEKSMKRIHRIGQKNNCFYYLLMVKNSVEEVILETLKTRKDYDDELFKKYEALFQ